MFERGTAASTVAPDAPRFIHDLAFDDLPDDVVRQAQRCLLDLIGCCSRWLTDHCVGDRQ